MSFSATQSRRPRSLAFRLYLIIIPVTVFIIVLYTYLNVRETSRMLDVQVESDTRDVALKLASSLAAGEVNVSSGNLRALLGSIQEANSFITRIEIYRFSGSVLTRSATTSMLPEVTVRTDEFLAVRKSKILVAPQDGGKSHRVKVVVPFESENGGAGCVSVISSLSASTLAAGVQKRLALVLIPVSVLVLVILLHSLFTRVVTGRIDRISFAMAAARKGDLQARAPVERADELGSIARCFNEAMDEIEKAQQERDRLLQEQKNFSNRLQERVSEATQELSASNSRLREVNRDLIDTQRLLTQYERMAMAGQMAATIAHEIGSPLSAISTQLELMTEDRAIDEVSRRRIQLVQEQIGRITGFVEELLSETRASVQAKSPLQLNRVLKQILLFFEQHLARHQVKVETDLAGDLPEIDANAHQLQQVFLNLLNNACDAMPGGGTVRLATRAARGQDGRQSVTVSVADTGTGIPEDRQAHLFEPFFTTKDLRRGTGLGLSIAARIVREHEGSIEVKSTHGLGTTFTIRFPASPTTPSASSRSEAERQRR
jgi:two-component system NtrC family sensor kinase